MEMVKKKKKKIGEIFIVYLFVLADFTSTENYLPCV